MTTKTTKDQQPPDTLWHAIHAVQGELGSVAKTGVARDYRYASLADVLDAVRAPLWRHGLVLTQDTKQTERGDVEVSTHIVHVATGERLTSSVTCAPHVPTNREGKATLSAPQSVGVAVTFARRYGILAALGLATDDTDGVSPQEQERFRQQAQQVSEQSVQSGQQPATPDDIMAPRIAALSALGDRIGKDEAQRRLRVVATVSEQTWMDDMAPTRERLADEMQGDPKAWRGLTDAGFGALMDALSQWPEGL